MTTTATCFYHPGTSATRQCAQCSLPLCGDCVETVANQSVCRRCVSAIRARVAGQMNAAPGQPGPAPGGPPPSYQPPSYQSGGMNPPPLTYGASPAAGGTDAGRLLLGVLAALAVGVIGAVIWEKIFFNLHFGLSLIYLGIGIGVAWALVTVGGGHTGLTAPLAMLITLAALMVGHLVLTYDATGVVSLAALQFVCAHLGPMHWVCVGLGLFGAYRTIERAG